MFLIPQIYCQKLSLPKNFYTYTIGTLKTLVNFGKYTARDKLTTTLAAVVSVTKHHRDKKRRQRQISAGEKHLHAAKKKHTAYQKIIKQKHIMYLM